MRLKKGTIQDVVRRTEDSGKRIIVYGAGVIGEAVAPSWLCRYGLEEAVLCYVDADAHKHGREIRLGSRSVPVRSLVALQEENYLLLITVSAFEPVVRSLERVPETEEVETYFFPIMLLENAHVPRKDGVVRTSKRPLIPKKIHYCWFSGRPIPELLRNCVASWKRFCPEYEIIRWDESNCDMGRSLYARQAYEKGKWGYIPDFVRLDILYRHGGIYLDTDVELLRSLDELLYQPSFFSTEKWGLVSGAVCGAQAGNPVFKSILDSRERVSFLYPDGSLNLTSSGVYDTIPLIRQGLQVNGETQVIAQGEAVVYASDFFQPFDYISGITNLTENTFAIHHFSGGWLSEEEAERRTATRRRYQEFLSRLEE